ncbi:NlpC/P60 family protein [Shewanella goraebulensis]|uniref:NlpC/P60 family protein n=1 Tax=Shewanella goraebulensis TaxID=3050637 RepID=UPI00254F17D0|nr:NlpC/P60 family protein [Shewanella goraebulensis]
MLRLSLVMCIGLFLSACASQPDTNSSQAHGDASQERIPVKAEGTLWNEVQLLKFHQQWQGTPYRLGGLSPQGIDCSGLVYVAYQDLIGSSIPRTVRGQTSLGNRIAKSDLQSGDLVFFKTTGSGRHVGIYLSGHRFLHVSTKKGVMISSMDNVYWKPRYWFASRL